jgi:hypothetical protein
MLHVQETGHSVSWSRTVVTYLDKGRVISVPEGSLHLLPSGLGWPHVSHREGRQGGQDAS